MAKKLYRSRNDHVIAGVCGGLANYFQINVAVVRIIAFILLLPGGLPGVLPYALLWIVIPLEPVAQTPKRDNVVDV